MTKCGSDPVSSDYFGTNIERAAYEMRFCPRFCRPAGCGVALELLVRMRCTIWLRLCCCGVAVAISSTIAAQSCRVTREGQVLEGGPVSIVADGFERESRVGRCAPSAGTRPIFRQTEATAAVSLRSALRADEAGTLDLAKSASLMVPTRASMRSACSGA